MRISNPNSWVLISYYLYCTVDVYQEMYVLTVQSSYRVSAMVYVWRPYTIIIRWLNGYRISILCIAFQTSLIYDEVVA
jgi:hypothetical protein